MQDVLWFAIADLDLEPLSPPWRKNTINETKLELESSWEAVHSDKYPTVRNTVWKVIEFFFFILPSPDVDK